MSIIAQQRDIPELVYAMIKEVYDANLEAIREQQEMLQSVQAYGDKLDSAGIPRYCPKGHPINFFDRVDILLKKVGE